MDGTVILGLLVALLAVWALLIAVLWLVRPRDIVLAEGDDPHVVTLSSTFGSARVHGPG